MNTSEAAREMYLPSILGVTFAEDTMEVTLSDGRRLTLPLAWYPRLAQAAPDQLKHFEISPGGYGIHWPALDEDLSVKGFLWPSPIA